LVSITGTRLMHTAIFTAVAPFECQIGLGDCTEEARDRHRRGQCAAPEEMRRNRRVF
jgi:hypothetical protein